MTFSTCKWISLVFLATVLSGCVSLPNIWPFHKPTPLQVVSTTEKQLGDVLTKLNGLQKQVADANAKIQVADVEQWAYVAQIATGIDYALTRSDFGPLAAVPRLLNQDILRAAQAKAPIDPSAVEAIKEIVDGLYSPVKTQLDAATAKLEELNTEVVVAQREEEAAVAKVSSLTKSSTDLQVKAATLETKLTTATNTAIKADDAKTQALATFEHIKWWIIGIASIIVICMIVSHLHLTTLLK